MNTGQPKEDAARRDRGNANPGLEHVVEVIEGAFDERDTNYHKLFLFDRLTRGERNWHFLIVTRRMTEQGKIEMAAFSYDLGDDGELRARLESRRALIPEHRLEEVIDGLLLRLDDIANDYSEYSLAGFNEEGSKLDKLRSLLGIEGGQGKEQDNGQREMQPGESDPGGAGLGPGGG